MSNNRPVPPKSHSPQIRFPLYTSFLHNDSSARKGIVIFFGTATNSFELLIPLHSMEKTFSVCTNFSALKNFCQCKNFSKYIEEFEKNSCQTWCKINSFVSSCSHDAVTYCCTVPEPTVQEGTSYTAAVFLLVKQMSPFAAEKH